MRTTKHQASDATRARRASSATSLSQPPPMARLARGMLRALPAGTLGWACASLVAILEAGRWQGVMPALFASGALGLWMALLVVPIGLLFPGATAAPDHRPDRSSAWLPVAMLALALASFPWLDAPILLAVGDSLAYREEIARALAVYAACVVAGAAGWLYWLRSLRARQRFPYWWLVLAYVAARWLTLPEKRLLATGREAALELGGLVFLLLCFRAAGPVRAGAERMGLRVLQALWVGSVLTLLTLVGSLAGARASLTTAYPGSAALLVWARASLDFDGDAVGGSLGGIDCNDANAAIHPLALEIPGNGIDENCIGGDLAAPPIEPKLTRKADAPKHNLLLITVDALRADMLGGQAPSGPDTMPALRRFARGGANFTRAYSQAPMTGNSLQSLLTGRYPMSFNGDHSEWLGSEPTLAQRLSGLGYATLVLNQVWQRDPATGQQLDRQKWSVYAGFGVVDDALAPLNDGYRGATSAQTTQRMIAHVDQLARGGRPFFAWAHYLDPHAEYLPRPGTPFEGNTPLDHYKQEVWETDRRIGELLAHVARRGLLHNTIVCISSDHGELLGEGGRYGHARMLDELVMRPVLVLAGPGVVTGSYATRVRLVDLYTTLLDLTAGVSAASDGRHLAEVWSGADTRDRDVFAQGTYAGSTNLRAALVGQWKLIWDLRAGVEYVYDLEHDPLEQHNLRDAEPRRVSALRMALGRQWDQSLNSVTLTRRMRRARCAAGDASACD